MTEEQIKEQLSKAFVTALAADAGFILRDFGGIDYGIDGKFCDVIITEDENGKKRYSENGFGIDFQLKASTNIKTKNGLLIYDLESKNYNDLVKTNIGTPRILIVYSMPEDRNEWLKIDRNQTILKKCAWWCSLRGQEPTTNKRKKRIEIPENNILTTKELQRLINLVKEGENL